MGAEPSFPVPGWLQFNSFEASPVVFDGKASGCLWQIGWDLIALLTGHKPLCDDIAEDCKKACKIAIRLGCPQAGGPWPMTKVYSQNCVANQECLKTGKGVKPHVGYGFNLLLRICPMLPEIEPNEVE